MGTKSGNIISKLNQSFQSIGLLWNRSIVICIHTEFTTVYSWSFHADFWLSSWVAVLDHPIIRDRLYPFHWDGASSWVSIWSILTRIFHSKQNLANVLDNQNSSIWLGIKIHAGAIGTVDVERGLLKRHTSGLYIAAISICIDKIQIL